MPTFHPLQLLARRPLATDAVQLTFAVPPELRDEFHGKPGQHLTVRATLDGQPRQRSYSIVSPPGDTLSVGVRIQGAMSRHLASGLRVGDAIEVMKPYGRFIAAADPAAAKSYLALAAGSGITPILAIASAVLAGEPRSRFRLVYGNRDIEHTMFLPEVLALKDRYLTRFVVHFVMSREPQDTPLFNGRLDAQRLHDLARQVLDLRSIDEFFICGPGSMVEDLSRTLRDLAVPGRIRVERFTAAPTTLPDAINARDGRAEPATNRLADAATAAVEVTVQMDGRRRSFTMPASGRTVLEAAEAVGLELPFSCRDGICATCRARLLQGKVEMDRNQGLESWELDAGFILCCQARPTTTQLTVSFDEK